MPSRKLKIKYLKSPDYKTLLSTGIYGGVTTNGLINANFYVDRSVFPETQIVEVDEKGKAVGQPEDVKESDIVREMQVGILLDVRTAKSIMKWLEEKINIYEEKIQKNK